MWEQALHYRTTLTPKECINSILRTPQQFECKWGSSLYYRAEKISDNRLLVTFTGGQFRKAKRSQYYVGFSFEDEQTIIVVSFVSELFGLPSMTAVPDIDLFIEQKTCGKREKMTYNY